jgi:hypothetical protein
VQHLINVQRDDNDIKKAIAQIKKDISEDIENQISFKFSELADQFVSSSYSITEGFKKLEQQNEELKAIIAQQTAEMKQNHI